MVGAFAGSLTLYEASSGILELLMAGLILFYIAFRIFKPGWQLSLKTAQKLNVPVGFLAGFLQGTFGISAPATLTFLNAIKFERSEFIAVISVYFLSTSIIQLQTLTYLGLMKTEHFVLGVLSIIPLVAGMPIGALLLRHAPTDLFDKVILLVLFGVAIRLLWTLQ